MLALLMAVVILVVGTQTDLSSWWYVVAILGFISALTPEGFLGPTIWRWFKDSGRRVVSRDDDPRDLTGSEFEYWVADHMRREGYDAEVIGGPNDGGCDVLAQRGPETVAVQCKRVSGSIGTEAVQDAISAREVHDADAGWLVTTASNVTEQARDLARRTGVQIHEV